MSLLTSAVKPIYWHRLWRRKMWYMLQGTKQGGPKANVQRKRPELPDGFQGMGLKTGWGGVHDQLVEILLIDWWWGNQESTSSTLWFQLVWGLHACGWHSVSFFHLVEVSVFAKTAERVWLRIFSTALEKELKVLAFLVDKLLLFCLA